MIAAADPKLTVPCSSTMRNDLEKNTKWWVYSNCYFPSPGQETFIYNFMLLQVKTNIKDELRRMPAKSLNIMLDIWTSSQKVLVIGFTAQY